MLFVDKVNVVGLSALFSPFLWTLNVVNDLRKLEINVNGHDPAKYGFRKRDSVFDHVMS